MAVAEVAIVPVKRGDKRRREESELIDYCVQFMWLHAQWLGAVLLCGGWFSVVVVHSYPSTRKLITDIASMLPALS